MHAPNQAANIYLFYFRATFPLTLSRFPSLSTFGHCSITHTVAKRFTSQQHPFAPSINVSKPSQPSQAKPSQTKPSQAKPSQSNPIQSNPIQSNPSQAKPKC
jgi:hypothetical protein